MPNEPVCMEVVASSSVGGKVQIVKYEYTADFHYSMTRKYSVPEDWTEQDIADFQLSKTQELREEIEKAAQVEMEELIRQRDAA